MKAKLETIPPIAEFYHVTIKRLLEEYGYKEKLRDPYTERLLEIAPVQSKDDIQGLRDMLEVVNTSISSLEYLGVPKQNVATSFLRTFKVAVPLGTTWKPNGAEEHHFDSNADQQKWTADNENGE